MQLFCMMFLQYFLVVANTRAYTQGRYLWTALTDVIFCIIGFKLIKVISVSTQESDMLWYVLGGVLGAQASIYVTKRLYGQ